MERISDWHPLLAASGAQIDESGVVKDFGDPAAEARALRDGGIVVPLTDSGLISVSGPDAASFLNAQLTSEIAALTLQHGQYTGYCTPKGRLLATMLAQFDGDIRWLMLPIVVAESVALRLQRYVLRAKVTVRVSNGALALFGVAGPLAATALGGGFTTPGSRWFDVVRRHDVFLMSLPGGRYLVSCPAQQASATWQQLSQRLKPAGSGLWDLQTIRSGIATVTDATQEAFIPQMIALDAYGGVNFEKGCYPGQEIVARTRYLGDLKRRLYYGHCSQPLAPGELIVACHNGDSVGTVTNAAANDQDVWEFLAVVRRDSVKADLGLCTQDGHAVTIDMPVTDMLGQDGN